ncbi:MAG TPA: sulfur carrier protein ThiS [Acidimicrobiales bacterium]|nr:sulfur carrier protein ThiS [Acidimicrobiales bacterium]
MDVTANGKPFTLADGATVADLLVAMDLAARVVAVEHNGDAVARSEHPHRVLRDGDRVEVVRAVAGG